MSFEGPPAAGRRLAGGGETLEDGERRFFGIDLLTEAVPGNIRKAEHFVAFLKRFVEYLKTRMRVLHVVAETPLSFLQHLKDITFIERRPLR